MIWLVKERERYMPSFPASRVVLIVSITHAIIRIKNTSQ
jgi:hypothetical protein